MTLHNLKISLIPTMSSVGQGFLSLSNRLIREVRIFVWAVRFIDYILLLFAV